MADPVFFPLDTAVQRDKIAPVFISRRRPSIHAQRRVQPLYPLRDSRAECRGFFWVLPGD
jgi:hypothetical protein